MLFFFFKQKTAYEMRISDWSSDVCSSDLLEFVQQVIRDLGRIPGRGIGHTRKAVIVLRREDDRWEKIIGTHGLCSFRANRCSSLRFLGSGRRRIRRLAVMLVFRRRRIDREGVVAGTSVSVCVNLGGRRIIKKKQVMINNTQL